MAIGTRTTAGWGERSQAADEAAPAAVLLRVADAALFGVICIAPFFFGGRHDMGRLVFVSLTAVAAVAWFLYQALQRDGGWPRTCVYAALVLAAALVTIQIMPLPAEWLAVVSPSISKLLPLWMPPGDAAELGTWRTLSLNPHETTKSLALLVSYIMLFAVVAGRLRTADDVQRVQKWIAVAAVIMAGFGILQYFTAGGRYFWFFEHPFRSSSTNMSGAFINRNHFAHFLILGTGPLVAWLLQLVPPPSHAAPSHKPHRTAAQRLGLWGAAAALVLVTLAIIGSRSRGAALVFVLAGVVLTAIYVYRRLVDSRFVYGLLGLAVAVGGILSLYGYEKVVRRLDDITEFSVQEMDQSGARRKIWAANIEAIEAFPLAGTGAGGHLEAAAIYVKEPSTKKYSHAESGYLQVASENGLVGAALLLIGIAFVGGWCGRCFFATLSVQESLLFGAAAAGLVASVAHSVFDFVWYIPACMSATIALVACALRLSQLASDRGATRENRVRVLQRGRWLELAAAAALIGVWSMHTYFGPAIAAVHWNRYLRASVADAELATESVEQFVAGVDVPSQEDRVLLSQSMLRHLEAAAYWDPYSARIHERLADRYVTAFELQMNVGQNFMDVAQIRATAAASDFTSGEQLDAWLSRAFGPQAKLLQKALFHAHRAVALSPLQADAYLRLADLSFLELDPATTQDAYIEQVMRIRPNDRSVLTTAGRQALQNSQFEAAIAHWKKCFHTPGRHQHEIIYLLVASGMPAAEFTALFQPDWSTLRLVWSQYKKVGDPQQLQAILFYSASLAETQGSKVAGTPPVFIWYCLSSFYDDVGQADAALDCLQRAYRCDPRQYSVRRALGRKLQAAGRLSEAEPHIRWCLARKPADKALSEALKEMSKARFAQRETSNSP